MTPLLARFERSRERAGRERDIGVGEPGEPFGFVGENHRLQQKEELQLLLGEPSDGRHQSRHVVIDLPLHDGGGVPLRGFEVPAVLWAVNLDQALGGAANRADFLAEGRADALSGAFLTQAGRPSLTDSIRIQLGHSPGSSGA